MRVVLDACMPRQLAREPTGCEVATVIELGWGDVDDAPLLEKLAGQCEVFVTVDKSLPRERSVQQCPFAVVVLRSKSNRLADLLPLAPSLVPILPALTPGQVVELPPPGA